MNTVSIDRYTISGCARLDNHQILCEKLELPTSTPDLELILNAFLHFKNQCTEHLLGDFSFLIRHLDSDIYFGARDHIGIKPFYYSTDNSKHINFALKPSYFSDPSNSNISVNKQALLTYLSDQFFSLDKTLFSGIKRLPAAHQIFFDGVTAKISRYWSLSTPKQPLRHKSLEQYVNHFKDLLFEAIRCRLPEGDLACELSGGIDSSCITACIAHLFPQKKIHAYSNCLSNEDRTSLTQDEKYLVDLLQSKYQFDTYFLNANSTSLTELISDGLKRVPYPLTHQVYVASRIMKKAQEQKLSVILSGYGGDEGVSYRGVDSVIKEHLQNNQFRKAIKVLNEDSKLTTTRFIKTYLKAIVPNLIQKLRPSAIFPYKENLFINPNFRDKWIPSIKYPSHFINTQHEMIYDLTELSFTTERLENFALLSETYGLEYRFPLLDIRLLEFFLSLPPELKYQDGTDRYLIRHAMEGILPDTIRLRKNKDISECPDHLILLKNSIAQNQLPEFNSHLFLNNKLNQYLKNEPHPHPSINEYEHQPILVYQLFEKMYPDFKIVDT